MLIKSMAKTKLNRVGNVLVDRAQSLQLQSNLCR